jgi:hypothetical protein
MLSQEIFGCLVFQINAIRVLFGTIVLLSEKDTRHAQRARRFGNIVILQRGELVEP